jgi:preprotein translocase subunit SecD
MSLKYRLLIVIGLSLASIWALFPRTVVERVKRDGAFVYDTVRRVPLKKGLDLQGGMHLALEVDESKGAVLDKSEAIDRALKVVRTRIDEFGVSEPLVQKAGNDRIIVELPGIDDPRRAQDVVQKSAYLEFQITDETQALEKALPRLDAILKNKKVGTGAPAAGKRDSAVAAGGLQSLFTTDTSKTDSTKADSAVAAVGGPGALSSLLQQGQMPGEFYVAQNNVPAVTQYLALPEVAGALPPGKVVRWSSDTVSIGNTIYRPLYVLDAKPIITGEFLTDAKPNTSPQEGNLVQFTMNNEGARRFRAETARHIKDYMAIVLDQRVMGRPPIIQSAIGANGQITMGGKDLQAAQDLALVLRAGSLPVPLKVVYTTQIGASLGQDSIQKGITAGVIAIALVIIIMVGYYRFAGALAIAGLALYLLYTLAALAGFNAVLTLPGLAGFILSIGLAVDANVLIFERIREELALGKTIRTSVDEGFRHAMSAIVDSEVTTALTAAVLYQYGTGPVRGFAVTLLAGTAASLFTAIFVVRTFFLVWLNRTPDTRTLSI